MMLVDIVHKYFESVRATFDSVSGQWSVAVGPFELNVCLRVRVLELKIQNKNKNEEEDVLRPSRWLTVSFNVACTE
jgi:hypothetical protein